MNQSINRKLSFVTAAAVRVKDNLLMNLVVTQKQEDSSNDALEQRGKKLRAEIRQTYKTLKSSKRLPFVEGRSEFINAVVGRYVPPGTPFKSAESILRNAKLKITDRLSYWTDQSSTDEQPYMRGETTLEKRMTGSAFFSVLVYPENASLTNTGVEKAVGLIGVDVLI